MSHNFLSKTQKILVITYAVGIMAQTITLYILDGEHFNMQWFIIYFILAILTTISYYKLFMVK
jgi:hypothetical protein